ncbi:hypothetical protein TSAR_010381, partial [Trichomalopsis sarcophagae]
SSAIGFCGHISGPNDSGPQLSSIASSGLSSPHQYRRHVTHLQLPFLAGPPLQSTLVNDGEVAVAFSSYHYKRPGALPRGAPRRSERYGSLKV